MRLTKLSINSDEIELVGNILQDICIFFQVTEGITTVEYPLVIDDLMTLTKRVEMLYSSKNQHSINMSEIIGYIKEFFARAEDSRILMDMFLRKIGTLLKPTLGKFMRKMLN